MSSSHDPSGAPGPLALAEAAVAEAENVVSQAQGTDRLRLVERRGRRTWTNAPPVPADERIVTEPPVAAVEPTGSTARAKALKPNVRVTIPSPTTLTPEEREAVDAGGGWPIRVAFPDAETFMRAFGRAGSSEPPAKSSRRRVPPERLTDDTYIDQWCGLLEKSVFLRLAHEGAFGSSRVGRRVLARWGDVKKALAERSTPATPAQTPAEELDSLRRRIGLVEKGGR